MAQIQLLNEYSLLFAGWVKMKPDHERVTKLLTDTVTLLCKNGLSYDRELRIQGLLGITVDCNEVFLVSINDSFSCSSASSLASVQSSVAHSAATASSQSRKRSSDDIVDLTRLVETPNIFSGVQPPQIPSSISPMHHGNRARPKSASSVGQSKSQSVTQNSLNVTSAHHHHSQPVARQSPFTTSVTNGHHRTSVGCSNSGERLASCYNQHSNALALVDSSAVCRGQRPHAGYIDSIHNLMLACERQLAPRGNSHGQYHRQLPPAGAAVWSGTDQHHSMQHRPMHQNMAAGDLPTVGRRGTEHISIPPPLRRQPVVPVMPGNAYVRRPEADSLHYVHTSTAVSGVSQPPTLSRHHVRGVPRPVYDDHLPYFGSIQQTHAAAPGRQLVSSAAYFQPPAKRNAPNHSPRQAMPSYNPAFVQSQLPHPHGCFPHSHSAPFSQQTCSVADPRALNPPPLTDMSTSHATCVTSSPIIKPSSSPVHSGRRSRPRQIEHIDLCGDDETADSGIHVPVSSIVIQPDNTDFLITTPDEAERLDIVSANTSDLYDNEFETAPEIGLPENDFPQLSRIREIVPLDDGLGNEDYEVSLVQNTVAAETAEQSTSASFSVPALSDSGRSIASNHLNSELSSAQLDISVDPLSTFQHSQVGIDSQLARLSADESQQMTALYFDTEDSDMHAQT